MNRACFYPTELVFSDLYQLLKKCERELLMIAMETVENSQFCIHF